MPDCPIDGRPTSDTTICRGCLDGLLAELRAIPALVEDLEVTLTRQARVGARNGPRGAETPLPFHLRASVDLEALHGGLLMWSRAVADRRGLPAPLPGFSTEGLARWLLLWPTDLATHPDAAELHGDVLAMVEAGRRTVDLPPTLHFVGPCDDCGADLYCGPLASTVACRTEGCEFAAPVAERRVWLLEQAVDQLRTAAELSRELPWIGGVAVNRKLINQWASRGLAGFKLTPYLPHPRDPRGFTRYRVGEVVEFARRSAMAGAERAG